MSPRKIKRLDYLHMVADGIEHVMGLKTNIVDDTETIEVDTIAGRMDFKIGFDHLMQDVYRLVYIYGIKLHKYGLSKRIEYNK